MNDEKELIGHLNDELRRNLTGGGAFMTLGVVALGSDVAERILEAIMLYDNFCQDSDPWGGARLRLGKDRRTHHSL